MGTYVFIRVLKEYNIFCFKNDGTSTLCCNFYNKADLSVNIQATTMRTAISTTLTNNVKCMFFFRQASGKVKTYKEHLF